MGSRIHGEHGGATKATSKWQGTGGTIVVSPASHPTPSSAGVPRPRLNLIPATTITSIVQVGQPLVSARETQATCWYIARNPAMSVKVTPHCINYTNMNFQSL